MMTLVKQGCNYPVDIRRRFDVYKLPIERLQGGIICLTPFFQDSFD